jgi:hypothetical protein
MQTNGSILTLQSRLPHLITREGAQKTSGSLLGALKM